MNVVPKNGAVSMKNECAREQDEAGMKVAKGFMGY